MHVLFVQGSNDAATLLAPELAEAWAGEAAIEVAAATTEARDRLSFREFDAVIVDAGDGEDADLAPLTFLLEDHPELPIVIVGPSNEESWMDQAFAKGAHEAIPLDEASPAVLLQALRRARLRGTIRRRLVHRARETRDLHRRLEESNRLLSIAGRTARIGGWSADLQRGVIHWSDEVCDIHEVPHGTVVDVEEGIGYYPPEWQPVIREHFVQCVEKGTPYDLELEILTANGKRRWVRAIGEAVPDGNGGIVAVQGAFQDITKSKEREEALLLSSRRFRELANALPLVVWTAEPDGTVDFFSEDLVRYTGLSLQELLGGWVGVIHPDDRPSLVDRWAHSLEEGVPHLAEFRIRRKDGTYRWHVGRAEPVRDDDRSITKWYGSVVDIHDRRRLEEEARELADLLTRTLENLTDAFYLFDRNWRILFVNPEAEKATRIPRDELLGQNLWDVFPELVDSPLQPEAERAIQEGQSRTFEYYFDRFERWFSARLYPSPDGLAVYVRDITEAKRAETRVQESEERFRLVARATSDVVYDWDLRSDELWWSAGAEGIFGSSISGLAPTMEDWANGIHPEDRVRVLERLEEFLASSEEKWGEEYRFRVDDGSWAHLRDEGYLIRDEDGRAIRMVGGISDQSRHQADQQRLQEQAALLEKARDAIVLRELDHTVVFWNPAAERLFGWSAEEAVGRPVTELAPTDEGLFREAMDQLMATGEWSGEMEKLHRDGSKLLVESRWTLLRDRHGEPYRCLSIDTDVTERKKLMEQFLRAQRLESIGTLAGGIAHDLNNVLAPILMAIGLLREELEAEPLQDTLETMESSARRGADLVRQVLSFSRGVEGARMPVHVPQVVDDLSRVIRDSFPKDIRFEGRVPDDLRPVTGDPTQIQQILLNLAVNSRDAMPQGGRLRLEARNVAVRDEDLAPESQARPGDYVRLTVKDSGTGIDESILDRIFDPFFTTKDVDRGTGLGLSTVAAIVRSHGGFIRVSSEVGRGTTFEVYLPAGKSIPVGHPASGDRDLARGVGQLVLVVDDEPSVRSVTRRILEAFGYRVITASDGVEAVGVYSRRGREIDLVLTDITMPNMDGDALVRTLRRMDPEVRVLFTSGRGSAPVRGPETGPEGDPFLPKPYTAETLAEAVHRVLEGT